MDLRSAIRLLVEALVILHVESHAACRAFEAGLVPELKQFSN